MLNLFNKRSKKGTHVSEYLRLANSSHVLSDMVVSNLSIGYDFSCEDVK